MAPDGPFVVWVDLGFDGWHPRSFETLEQAFDYHPDEEYCVTKIIRKSNDER